MLIHPEFDPVAIRLGPLAIHWYGLSYLAAFILFVLLGRMRLRQKPYARQVEQGLWRTTDVEDLLLAGILGVILGGRLGYVLFYKPQWYLSHPLDIFKVWEGGMSFHGGLLGVLGMFTWFAWRRQRPWLEVSDLSHLAYLPDWQLAAWAISSMASCGGAKQMPPYLGPWPFRKAAACCRATRRNCIKCCLKACCSSSSCGSTPAKRPAAARCLPPF